MVVRNNVFGIVVFATLVLSCTTARASHILDQATSARMAGMADIGVMLNEGDSYRHNPAVIGLPSERGSRQAFFSISPDRNGTGRDSYAGGLAMRPSQDSTSGGLKVGAAVDFAYSILDDIPTYTYGSGPDYGDDLYPIVSTFRWEDYAVGANVALGWTGRTSFSFGAAVNWLRESIGMYEADCWTTDLGAYLTTCLNVPGLGPNGNDRFTIGASYSNLGVDESRIGAWGLEETFKIGGALELYWTDDAGRKSYVMPMIERNDIGAMRVGLEMTFHSLVYLRAGHNNKDDYSYGYSSYGFSLSTLGLRKKTVSGHEAGGSLFDRIVVELHYAYNPTTKNHLDGTEYFGVGISF